MFVLSDAKIAAGYDNVGGLTLITALTAGGVFFVEPLEYPDDSYDRGVPRVFTNGIRRFEGFPTRRWLSGVLWLPQYELLRTTYEGPVTFRTRLFGTTYANYNGILTLPELGELDVVNETKRGLAAQNFVWTFTRVRAI
jgi:hypothetical protein